MTDHDPTPVAIQPPPRIDPAEQVTRALSLMVRPSDAARAVHEAIEFTSGEDLLEVCRHAARSAIRHHFRARWLEMISWWRQHHETNAPLGPASRVASQDAAVLALHLGVGLDLDELSDILSRSPDRISRSLARARLTLLQESNPCGGAYLHLLGVIDDRLLDVHERHERREHLRQCPACLNLIEHFRLLDQRLTSSLASTPVPDAPDRSVSTPLLRSPWFAPLAATALAVAVCLALGGLIVGGDRVLGGDSTPIPLIEPDAPDGLEGWLVSSTIDGIGARNLATGEHRMLLNIPIDQSEPPVIMMSPSGDRVAIWRFQDTNQITNSVDIVSLDGEILQTWRWDRTSSPGQITNWLNDDELLFIQAPGMESDESTEDFVERQTRENQLLAINVLTGSRRVLFTGSVAMALPSPNQEYMAILGIYNPRTAEFPGRTVEIRRIVEGRLGEPVAVAEDRYPLETTRPIWSYDSSSLFFLRLDDEALGTERDPNQEQRVDIARMMLDGNVEVLTDNQDRERLRLLGVAPDLSRYLYLQSNPGSGPVTWNLFQAPLNGGDPAVVAEEIGYPYFFSATATWNSDSSIAIVNDSQTHFVHGDSDSRTAKAGGTRFLAVREDNSFEELATDPGIWGVDAWGRRTLRWYPEERVTSRLEDGRRAVNGIFSSPEVVDDGGRNRHTTEYSEVSPGGQYVLFEHSSTGVPFVWNIQSEAGRLLAGTPAPEDVSWGPGDRSLVGVERGAEDPKSEILLFASHSSRIANYFDYRGADAQQFGDDADRTYAAPTFSPSGTYLAYFVENKANKKTEFWVAGQESGHRTVLDWTAPEDSLVDQQLVAVWTSESTLLVAVPDEWDAGFPTRISLLQVNLASQGKEIDISEKHTWSIRGGDNGLVVVSIDFSPDRNFVAFRERIFTRNDPDRGQRDQIIVASANDVNQSVTIARGDPGDGLAWSPDSAWISYGIDGEIVVSQRDGTDTRSLSEPGNNGRFPLWQPDGTLYFTIGTENAPELVRIVTR